MPRWSMVVFLVVMGVVLYAVNRRTLRWFTTSFGLSRRTVQAISVVLGGSLALVLLGRVASLLFPSLPLGGALSVGFTAQLAVLVSVILLLPFDLALGIRRLVGRLRRSDGKTV